MFKFLHAADVHLDSPLRGLDRYEGCPSDEIRGATRRALENLVRLAIVEKVAFVLIAGDVYDGDWKDHNTGLWFVKRLAELRDSGIKVFLIRGNHDAKNRMTRDLRLPDNVTSLDVNQPQTCHLDHFPVAIHGQGFASQAVTEDLAANYPASDPGCFNVGMLHTSVTGREGHDRYAPCTVEALRAKNYGYWALGHVHAREILDQSDGPIVFPGNVQGRHIRESGPKGCMIVTVDGHHVVSSDFRPLDVLRWETCRVDATGLANGDDVLKGFQDALPDLLEQAEGRPLALRVEVFGASAVHEKLLADKEGWSNEIRSQANVHGSNRVWVEAVKLRTRPLKIADEVSGDGPLEELDRLLVELLGDDRRLTEFAGRELADLRKKIPLELRRSDLVDLDGPDWLRGVLGQVRPLLADRFEASRTGR
jgi:DNA repair protein SbcD/Mre11